MAGRTLYRLNGVAHIAGSIGDEPTRCIYSVRRQQNMPLHDRIIPYLERAGLYHLARLNSEWFWLDEPLVSAFVERWRPETHTFHLPFRECTVTLQDVAFQLGLPVDGEAVSGCLGEFETYMEGGRPAWKWFTVLPADASEETVCIYARAYIMMLLSTQLFGDKSANRVHIRWLPFVANLDDMGRWSAYLPPNDGKEQRVIRYRLALDRLTARDLSFIAVRVSFLIVWEPYSALDVLAVVHPEILTEEHSRLWRAVTSLIYFAVIEWHQVDRVVPQLGGVQHIPEDGLNVDWLYAKDGRGGDRWFPHYYQVWHLHWGNRLDAVISIDRVADPGPSANYLDWWFREAQQFLSPGAAFADPRGTQIPPEAFQRGSSQVPRRSQLPDMPDNRRVERRRRVGTRDTGREW
ncbi:serine/threonine-protein phosphatase 7 long form homolog [Arachis ipaensis]|uniref:serine/threonine-protein phosphatase 7 long form homolog n=1 Tax=Arachis ipaensis TaxID=130454 RepID=UPI0007AFD483|nr:serine/threonine-protein phosphatase 7 long form homolog [Arachis ipaensis]XP_025627985.1 serine/threonine-protein phosphatase 7 long form homolog [Arachis hypogaea]